MPPSQIDTDHICFTQDGNDKLLRQHEWIQILKTNYYDNYYR
jgi:hypothetical protein